jgi:hypothetical protein
MKRTVKAKRNLTSEPQLFIGYQWGEPPSGQSRFLVSRIGEELEITAAMPEYMSETRSCDLLQQYGIARKNRSIGKQRAGKDSPHIRFANADSDDDLIDFVRDFGPVVSMNWRILPYQPPSGSDCAGHAPLLMRVRQDLKELRSEQRIYKAALSLVSELAKKETEFDIDSAKERMGEIVRGIRDWPRQWNREKKARGNNPLWRVRSGSIRRIAGLAKSGRDPLLPPQLDARIVICELVNVFPSLAFPNPPEMHSYICFGIRPLLYSVIRREFLQPRDVGICANTQCRAFFEVERAGQRFCDDQCSRRQRQRENWQTHGKTARKKRLAGLSKGRKLKPPAAEFPSAG